MKKYRDNNFNFRIMIIKSLENNSVHLVTLRKILSLHHLPHNFTHHFSNASYLTFNNLNHHGLFPATLCVIFLIALNKINFNILTHGFLFIPMVIQKLPVRQNYKKNLNCKQIF
jgi:hypothetical protein